MAWNFFVRHYDSDAVQQQDVKYRETWGGARVDGVLYPRAATLGGCTAHNAMIMIYPHDADWDEIARLTGDASWSSGRMRTYFQRLENCHHRRWPPYRWLARIGIDPTRHGWSGWLQTERAIPRSALGRPGAAEGHEAGRPRSPPPDRRAAQPAAMAVAGSARPERLAAGGRQNAVGVGYMPLATRHHARTGARERVLEVARRYPDRLRLELNALATRVLLDAGQSRRRGRVPARRAALRRAPRAERRRGRAPRGPRLAGGRPCRRRLQYTPAADALRHRSARDAASATASRSGWIFPAWARTCRTATRSAW